MLVLNRTVVSKLAAAVAASQPSPSTQHPAVKSPYQFGGTSLERIGKYGTSWNVALPLPKRSEAIINVSTSYANNKAINEAKQLSHQADDLRWSDLPSDRLRAYEMMREAGQKLKNVDPKVAAEFEKAAQMHLFFDQKVNQYQGLLAAGYSKEQANAATVTPNFPYNRGGELNEAMAAFGRAYGALERM